MTKVVILSEATEDGQPSYRAIAGDRQSVGNTAGAALDALTALLPSEETGTLVIVQDHRPDRFFTAEQQQRLQELMSRWRAARDNGALLQENEQAELDALVEVELRAATARAEELLRNLEA